MPRSPSIDFNLLGPFIQVAEAANFTAAAQKLGVRRSSMSRSVASIEQALGIQLFRRTTRRNGITAAGSALYAKLSLLTKRAGALALQRLLRGGSGLSNSGLLRLAKSVPLRSRALAASKRLSSAIIRVRLRPVLRASLCLGLTVLCACGSTDGSPSSSNAGSSAGGINAAAGATQGGYAGIVNGAGASSGGAAAGSGNGGGDAGTTNGGIASAGGGSASGAGGMLCNTLINAAPVVHEMTIEDNPPAPLGGTITDGTYYETSYLVYTESPSEKPSTTTHQLTAQIKGSILQVVFVDDANTEQRVTLELRPNGTMLSEHQTCRTNTKFMMNNFDVLGYDASPTSFTIHLLQDEASGDYVVYTWTKQ